MTKDRKYIENLFRNYKRNKARLKVLELGLLDDDDYTLGSIDYSSDNVQTSNIATLDNRIIARENETKRLKKDLTITEILLDSLDSRKDNQYKNVVNNYWIEGMTYTEVMPLVNIYSADNYFKLCNRVADSLLELLKEA